MVIGTPAHLAEHSTTMASYLSLCCLQYTLINNTVTIFTRHSTNSPQTGNCDNHTVHTTYRPLTYPASVGRHLYLHAILYNLRKEHVCSTTARLYKRFQLLIYLSSKVIIVCVALGIQHAMRMRRVILSSVAWPALSTFPRKHFRNKSYRT